jgi:hypothetical protein
VYAAAVDLPAPFGPRKPVTTPGWTTKSSLSTASFSLYRLLRFSKVLYLDHRVFLFSWSVMLSSRPGWPRARWVVSQPVNHVRAMAALTVGGSAAGSGRGRGFLVVWIWVLTVGLLAVVAGR